MDFHFYTSNDKAVGKKSNLSKTLLAFLPLFILAGILPITLGLVKNPITDRFSSQAAENDLTIWFTPSNVITSKDKPVELTLHAHFESDNLLSGVTFPVKVEGASIKNPQIKYIKPFNGEVVLGTVTVSPIKAGELKVIVDPTSVVSETFQGVFHVFVSNANIVVQ